MGEKHLLLQYSGHNNVAATNMHERCYAWRRRRRGPPFSVGSRGERKRESGVLVYFTTLTRRMAETAPLIPIPHTVE